MKTIYRALIVLLLTSSIANQVAAQVTIGSVITPQEGSLLELREYETKQDGTTSTKGLLLPRVELTSYRDLKDIGVTETDLRPQIGMLVYHTSTENCNYIPHGVYLWTGEEWTSVQGKSSATIGTTKKGVEEPNSYIINGAGVVRIPISKAYKMWNQIDFRDDYDEDLISSIPFTNLTAKVIWMDNKGVVCKLNFPPQNEVNENSILEVQIGNTYGNAVVGVEWNGRIMWSWHIWVTPNVGQETANGHVWMDRNLGAMANTENNAESRGMLYQWGRNTPFPNTLTNGSEEPQLFDINGDIVTIRNIESEDIGGKNLESAINYPLAYITNSTPPYYDWFSPSRTTKWLKRWDKDGTKAPMDPCPEGWRVPPTDSNGASPWKGIALGLASDFKEGWNWANFGYYPLTGSRTGKDGKLSGKDSGGHYWTASAPLGFPQAMYLSKDAVLDQAQSYTGEAFAVRCIRE